MPPKPHITHRQIGEEHGPLLVIDPCVADVAALTDIAAVQDFRTMGAYYPGLRAPLPMAVLRALVAPYAALIGETFGLSPDLGLIEAMFSTVTTPPADLKPIQRLPHFDGCEPERLAMLVYLGGCAGGGTSFYRHRRTGFEAITPARLAPYTAALHDDVASFGMPAPGYIAGDTAMFTRIAHFEGLAGRALIYRGNLLHCADIAPGTRLSAMPGEGRLTANIFLMGRAV